MSKEQATTLATIITISEFTGATLLQLSSTKQALS